MIQSLDDFVDAWLDFDVYDETNNTVTVLKDSVINPKIEIFKGTTAIEKHREGVIKNGKVIKDIAFNSPSTAASFVTGRSTNGMIAWKTGDGQNLKKISDMIKYKL